MIKRYSKLLILTILFICILMIPSFAKEVTKDNINEEINKIDSDSYYIIVIGEHVFTSNYIIQTEDVMLAARSINVENAQKEDMAIYTLSREYNGMKPTGKWIVEDNILGKQLDKENPVLNISYIDNQIIPEDTKIKVSLDNVDELLKEAKDTLKYEKNSKDLKLSKTGELTGLIEKNEQVDTSVFPQKELTGYYFAYTLEVEGEITDATTVKLTNGNSVAKVLTGKSAFDDLNNGRMLILAHLDKNSENKTLKVEVDLDGEAENYGSAEYTIDWSKVNFQSNSEYTKVAIGTNTEEASNEGYISSEDKTQIENWGYDFDNAGNDLKVEEQKGQIPYRLTGKVKQQELKEGVFSEANGYYVVLKVYGPDASNIQQKNWTVQFKNEEGNYKDAIKPTEQDYNNGFTTVLMKLNKDGDKKITYKIDWDGEGNYFLPYEETIDYSGLEFLEAHKIKVQGSDKTVTVWDGEEIPAEEIEKIKQEDKETTYHSFAYWTKEDGTKVDELTLENLLDENGNVTLVPHWNLCADKFINDVIADLNSPKGKEDGSQSEDFHEKFVFEQQDINNIKIKIVDPNTPLSEMNNTSIPGTIAYILEKDEIKAITFEVNEENKVTFDKNGVRAENGISLVEELPLKVKVQEGLKALYAKVLGEAGNDEKTTLSAMAIGENSSFKIKISEIDEKVTLTNEEGKTIPTEYTFTFDSSMVAVVKNEEELKQALANETVTEIFVAKDMELGDINDDEKQSHTLIITIPDRKVIIKSLDSQNPVTISDTEQTEEGEKDKTPVIEVTAGEVTFEDIKIEGATRAISVLSGAKVTAKNVVAIDSQDTAFDVAEGATFTAEGLQYLKTTQDGNTTNKESYHYPTICGKGTVDVTDVEEKKVTDYKRIVVGKEGNYEDKDFRNPETNEYYPEFQDPNNPNELKQEYKDLLGKPGNMAWDELRNTQHTHYYLNAENAEYYMVYLRDGAITRKYFAKSDEIEKTKENYNSTGYYKNVLIVDGKSYVHDGWSKSSYYTLTASAKREYKWGTAKITDPEEAKNCTLYPRYVEGYSVSIETDEPKDSETKITKRFGVKKDEPKTIQDLINEIPEYKTVYETLEQKAQATGDVIVDENNSNSQVERTTQISSDMKLKVGKVQQVSYAQVIGPNTNELTTSGNSISGIINTKNEDGKYYLPIKIASENFQNEVSTVTVTDPNNNTQVYTYSENAENGIKTVSNVKTMNLQLEAIKESDITGGNKIYKIAIDMDGENESKYDILNYIFDYNKVKTLEEMINKAANNTQSAKNLTLERDNNIKGVSQKCTVQYDRETGRRCYTEGNVFQYTFVASEVNSASKSNICAQKVEAQANDGKVYLNNWQYCSSFSRVSNGVIELELLKDIVKADGTIKAIAEVNRIDEQENTYLVVVSHEKLSSWLNINYIDFETGETKEGENTFKFEDRVGVILKVTLDSKNEYVTGIETVNNFTITKGEEDQQKQTYNNNKINVKISNIGETSIKEPKQMLGKDDETPATNAEIQDFIQKGKEWWNNHK